MRETLELGGILFLVLAAFAVEVVLGLAALGIALVLVASFGSVPRRARSRH